MSEDIRIIEVNGVKLEIDMRHAKRIDQFKVGSPVKVLVKGYGDNYDVKYGVIVDFSEFKTRPAIEILAIDPGAYGSDPLKFYTLTSDSKDIEIAPLGEVDHLFAKDNVVNKFQREIETKEVELAQIKRKQALFEQHFGMFFDAGVPVHE